MRPGHGPLRAAEPCQVLDLSEGCDEIDVCLRRRLVLRALRFVIRRAATWIGLRHDVFEHSSRTPWQCSVGTRCE